MVTLALAVGLWYGIRTRNELFTIIFGCLVCTTLLIVLLGCPKLQSRSGRRHQRPPSIMKEIVSIKKSECPRVMEFQLQDEFRECLDQTV